MKDSREIIPRHIAEKVEIERPFEPQLPSTGGYGYRNYGEATEGFQLIDYWRAIRKRLWLVIGITVLFTTLTAIYMARKPNIYQAHAMVQVDLEQANPDLVTKDRTAPIAQSDPAYFNTQLQLLYSDSLLRRVVKELSLDSNKEIQQARAEESSGALRSLLKAVGLASSDEKKAEKNVGEVLPSQNADLATTEEIAEAVRLAPYVELIKKNLGIEPIRESRVTVKDTRLIDVSFRHTNPELAAAVVNGICGTFTKANLEKRTGVSKKTNDFLEERIATLQSDVKNDEQKLVDLKQTSGILDLDEQQTLVVNALAILNKDLLNAENARKNAEAEYNSVKDSPNGVQSRVEEMAARYVTEQENRIRDYESDTQKNIAALKAEKSKLLKEYLPTAQEVREIDGKIEELESDVQKLKSKFQKGLEDYRSRVSQTVLTNLRTKYLQAQQAENKIRAEFDKKYNEAQGQSQAAINIKLLEQNIETNKGFLKNLIEQQSGNDIKAKGSDNNISVTEFAVPPEIPVSPRRLMTVFAALVLSTLFGAGLALFLEYLDDTVRSSEDVENLLQLPALAAIPTIDSIPQKRRLSLVSGSGEDEDEKPKSELLISSDSRSSLAEAYRQLRTSILLSTAGHAPKSLLVTSSLPSEGKTTTAVNTAISLAQTGAKVLIIDSDMRRPRLHSIFDISNAQGLSTLLSSNWTDEDILDVVQYDEDAKLHLLPSGPVPPNPAELIGSEQMANLLRTMQDNFTHVVVDSPPIASFTDGVLIASMVDGVILVVHSGRSSRQVVRRSRQLLMDIGAKIFGVVLNNVNLRSQDNYYYYQSYYHRSYYRSDEEQ